MSRTTVLARARAAALRGMTDTCTVTRVTGTTPDATTGRMVKQITEIYSGVCRVQRPGGGAQSRPEEAGEAYVRMLSVEVQLPITDAVFQRKDLVTIDTAVNDPTLVGREVIVRDLSHKSEASSRRLQCEEVT